MNSTPNTTPSRTPNESHEPPVDAALSEAWFDQLPPSSLRRSVPPSVPVGEFLGDPLADSWLR